MVFGEHQFEHVEGPHQASEGRLQFVGGVAYEALLFLEVSFQGIGHMVEGIGQLVDLIASGGQVDARLEFPFLQLGGGLHHLAQGIGEDPGDEYPP